MAPAAQKLLFKGTFNRGFVRDTARHAVPDGGVYDSLDFMLERPGMAYKRGGWERHSAQLGAATTVSAVATIHIPTRVVAVTGSTLYDVTSEGSPQATSIGACYSPAENPPLTPDGKRIFCDPAAAGVPKVVYYNSGGATMAITTLYGSVGVLPAGRSTVHAGYVVLGRGDQSNALNPLNRVWFPPDPVLEPLVDPLDDFVDVTSEIIGFASCSGVLLVFSPASIERIVGSVAPGRRGENMELQPLAGVGCLDARSIVRLDESVIFAGQEGVWLCNGAGVRSLTERPDGSGIQSYWESLFPVRTVRQIAAGLLYRNYYIVNVLDTSNALVACLIHHIPSGSWTRVSNIAARMFAQGRTEQEALELYFAAAPEGYVNRLSSILTPDWTHKADGNGTTVAPLLEVPFGDAGLLKEWRQGRLSYRSTTGETAVWQAAHVYALAAQIVESNQVWEITARTGDFKSAAVVEPTWATADDVGDTLVDNHVTWTNRGPQLIVSTAPGLAAPTFTVRKQMPLSTGRRAPFDVLADNEQTVTIRIQQSGASATTEIHGLEADVRTYEQGVTGGE